MSPGTTTRLELRATPEAVRQGREAVATAAVELGLSSTVVDDIRLCVSEALTNAVRHAYEDDAGTVAVSVERRGQGVLVVARDFGSWTRADDRNRPESHGFGLKIIRVLADESSVEQTDEGTVVSMAFGTSRTRA